LLQLRQHPRLESIDLLRRRAVRKEEGFFELAPELRRLAASQSALANCKSLAQLSTFGIREGRDFSSQDVEYAGTPRLDDTIDFCPKVTQQALQASPKLVISGNLHLDLSQLLGPLPRTENSLPLLRFHDCDGLLSSVAADLGELNE
jgi:hypothetical protein